MESLKEFSARLKEIKAEIPTCRAGEQIKEMNILKLHLEFQDELYSEGLIGKKDIEVFKRRINEIKVDLMGI